jgi:lysophospholipase L1-like esterase
LLGSSSMEGIKEKDLFPEYTMANRGISGDRIGIGGFRGVLHRLYCSAFDCKPRAVILLNGTNDLASTARGGNPSIAEIAETFDQVVKRLRAGLPNAHIFVVSCTPTRGKYENLASYIRKYNDLLEQQVRASKDAKLHFIDIYTPVVGPGNLIREDLSRDGLHLNKDGYQILKAKFVEALDAAGVEKY